MGNWRTVNLIGTCSAEEVEGLKAAASYNLETITEDGFGPLSYSPNGSLCGLNEWPAESMTVIGNLAERDYEPDDVARHLEKLQKVAPSLRLKIHCGGDYEELDCVATVVCDEGGVKVRSPEIDKLMGIPRAQIEGEFLKAMRR